MGTHPQRSRLFAFLGANMEAVIKTELESGWKKTRFGGIVHTGSIKGVTGERGLIMAIIDRARLDFLFNSKVKKKEEQVKRAEERLQTKAAFFFLGDDYKHWLRLLGIPTEYLPDGITTARLKYQIARYPIADS